MRLCFLGSSHAARHLRSAAGDKGFEIVSLSDDPDLLFVSEDTPTRPDGTRDTWPIRELCEIAGSLFKGPIVLTSQVEPGFTRSLNIGDVYHQAETLRIRDAAERASKPEMLIVGSETGKELIQDSYAEYLCAWACPILRMTFEEAEFAKIAINMTLAAQVDSANRLSAAALKVGADWGRISDVLRHDARIGRNSYLTPGRWQASPHLLRDSVTLREIEAR